MDTPDYPDLLILAIPFFIAFILFEIFWLKKLGLEKAYEKKDAITSLIMGSGMSIMDLLFKGVYLAVLFFFWQFRIFDLGFGIWVLLAALIIDDFFYYIKHFLYHKVRWMWGSHVVHHSSEHYNLTTALRQPWTNIISGSVFIHVPMVLLGFHPLMIVFVSAISLLYQFWIHTEAIDKMPKWFEFIFNTPSHHRVHHGRNPRYLDANYAGILIIWDRMFGTFVPELENEKPEFGIVKPLKSFNPLIVAFHEYAAILRDFFSKDASLIDRIKYLFGAPGYSHDNSRKTVAQIKGEYLANHPDQIGTPGFDSKFALKTTKN